MATPRTYVLQMLNGTFNDEVVSTVERQVDKNLNNVKWVKDHSEERDGGRIRILFKIPDIIPELNRALTVGDRNELIERYAKAGWHAQIVNSTIPGWLMFSLADYPTQLSSEGG